jgi:ribosomal protein S18 acetylase RimI-like enzyme
MRLLMEIAPLPVELVETAIELWHGVGLTRPWNDPLADLRRAMEGPASAVLAGLDGHMLLATALVGHDGHRGWVYYLAVRPESQRNGYGRQMMRACEEWLVARGIPKINLMVRAENAIARDFYAALGYRVDDVMVLSRRFSD